MKRSAAILFLCAIFAFYAPCAGNAAESGGVAPNELVAPLSAVLSPNGGTLSVVQKAKVRLVNGKPLVSLVLPGGSANLQLAVEGHTIVRWSSTPVLLDNDGDLAGRRARVEKERAELTASLMTVNSRLALWQALPKSANAQEVAQLQSAMQEAMPALATEQASLERRLKLVNEELSRMPQASGLGERVRVVLGGTAKEGDEVTLRYTYNHDSCGWEAIYDFNARPDEGSGDIIDVRLLAEVWQFTGMDWRDTAITLVTRGSGPRQPAPLPEWIIDSAKPRPQPRVAALSAKMAAPMAAEADAVNAGAAEVYGDTDSLYASWTLPEKGLPQGRSRLQISASTWKAPLQWLARPSKGENQVWLLAKYDLPQNQAWPAGLAEYSVNGQRVGNGDFRPRSGEAVMYFGSDPRVSITTTTDSYKRGQSGIISSSKTWTWSWTYTITNEHNKAIQVRVERPAPFIVDQAVTVSYKNVPPAKEDQKEHMLYWLIDVPAHGKKTIEHSVTLSSPTKLPLLPDVP